MEERYTRESVRQAKRASCRGRQSVCAPLPQTLQHLCFFKQPKLQMPADQCCQDKAAYEHADNDDSGKHGATPAGHPAMRRRHQQRPLIVGDLHESHNRVHGLVVALCNVDWLLGVRLRGEKLIVVTLLFKQTRTMGSTGSK